jgi:hypothetical protein
MFVLCCKNKDQRFMLTTIKRALKEHELSWPFFCIPNLYVQMFVTIAIVLQLGRPKLFWFVFCILSLSICMYVPIAIVLQLEGLEVSHLSLFIFVLLPCLWCWSFMDHHADVLSPINISLWMLLLLRYEYALHKGRQHSKGPKLDNSWEHPSSIVVERASMHFSITISLLSACSLVCHPYPMLLKSFWMHIWFLLSPWTSFARTFQNAPFISTLPPKPPLAKSSKVHPPFPFSDLKSPLPQSSRMQPPFPLYHFKPLLP